MFSNVLNPIIFKQLMGKDNHYVWSYSQSKLVPELTCLGNVSKDLNVQLNVLNQALMFNNENTAQ